MACCVAGPARPVALAPSLDGEDVDGTRVDADSRFEEGFDMTSGPKSTPPRAQRDPKVALPKTPPIATQGLQNGEPHMVRIAKRTP